MSRTLSCVLVFLGSASCGGSDTYRENEDYDESVAEGRLDSKVPPPSPPLYPDHSVEPTHVEPTNEHLIPAGSNDPASSPGQPASSPTEQGVQ